MNPTKKISVVLVAPAEYHNSSSIHLDDTLKSLEKQTYPKELTEVIVCPTQWTNEYETEFRKRYPNVIIVETRGYGYFYLKNLGIRASTGDIIAMADADCMYSGVWLESIAETIGSGNDVAAGLTVLEGKGITRKLGAFYTMDSMLIRHKGRVWKFNSNNIAFTRAALLDTMYNEAFERVGGCLQLAWNLNTKGYVMGFNPRQFAVHNFYGFRAHSFNQALGNGFEIFELRRSFPQAPLSRLIQLHAAAPPLFTGIFFASDLVNIYQNWRLLKFRLFELPVLVSFSFTVRMLEMIGMYWTLIHRRSIEAFVSRSDAR
jgi:glycosyltransferase involved in cell wall biosynthesis